MEAIRCTGCVNTAATMMNFYASTKGGSHTEPCCDACAEHFKQMSGGYWNAWDFFLRLYNPALCTPADLANVRAALEAVARVCRALWCDDAESREDRDVLVLCAEEVRVLEGREEAA